MCIFALAVLVFVYSVYLILMSSCCTLLFFTPHTQTAMLALKPNENENVLGLFAPSHCEYNYKIDGISDTDPTLKEMTMKAIEILSTNPKGFFLFVEGGKIDLALHENHAHIALEETAEFSRAIQVATEMVDFNDTLVVVTADHSHTLSYGGYPVSCDTNFVFFSLQSQKNIEENKQKLNRQTHSNYRIEVRIFSELPPAETTIPYHT